MTAGGAPGSAGGTQERRQGTAAGSTPGAAGGAQERGRSTTAGGAPHAAGGASHGSWTRFPAAALALWLVTAVKGAVPFVVAVVASFVADRPEVGWMVVAVVAFMLIAPVLRWLTVRYRLGDEGVALRESLFTRRQRTIPYGHVHAITVEQPPVLRLFGLVRLVVSSGDSSDGSIALDAVPASLQMAIEARRRAAAGAVGSLTADDAAEPSPTAAAAMPTPAAAMPTPAAAMQSLAATATVPVGPAADVSATAPTGATPIPADAAPCPTDATPILTDAALAESTPVSADAAPTDVTLAGSASIPSIGPSPSSATQVPAGPAPASPAAASSSPAASASSAPHPGTGTLAYRASTRDILLFALTDLSLLVWALALWGLFQKIDDWFPDQAEAAVSGATALVLAHGVVGVAVAFVAVLVVLAAISTVASLLRYAGFEAWRRGGDLVVVRGLVTRRTITIPVGRIQSVTVTRNPLRKALRLCKVEVGLSARLGGDGGDDTSTSDEATLLPVIGDDRVVATLRAMLPEWDVRPVPMRRTGRGLMRMYLTAPLAMAAIGAAAGIGGMAAMGAAQAGGAAAMRGLAIAGGVTALIGLCWMATRWLKYQTDAYALLPDADGSGGIVVHGTDADSTKHAADDVVIAPLPHRIMVTTANGLAMCTIVTRRARVQSVERSTTPWRQRAGVERLVMPLYVANGPSELRFTALRHADADCLAAWADDEAGADSSDSATRA
ncbi:PH domain-containing protein [Bifidobacterium pullorum subsp. saeculare]|uniref:PH domain-containing protein n=1 Tax=Bifidobacterium pullorum subsp. saeculare TaxID=78257 RepID=A0A938WZJ7_9BIFI|nr:PH domain-containing protein [Bifidobacterium pullorum]MBM6700184.1 PH domain-containing protein [Bifidobacterium pullorum subsp. saeculare]